MSLKVNEIFYSLQGEGIRAGRASIFIRLADCNLTCNFCDTEFTSGKEMTPEEILLYIDRFNCREIVWTGGEPLLQLNANKDCTIFFKNLGYKNCIETNGSIKPDCEIDHLTISPKVADHVIKRNFQDRHITELKYVRHKGQFALPEADIPADHYFISPMSDGNEINMENLKHCIELIKADKTDKWQLTIQMHKLWKVL